MRLGLLLFFAGIFFNSSFASVYQLPKENSRLIGENVEHQVIEGDYFQALAEYYNVGMLALLAANPSVDPFLPVEGSTVTIPKRMLLPYGPREGIVINLSELRLYYFPPGENLVYVFPVGIGKQGLSTPKVSSYIGEKRKNPTWRPTQAMRERYKEEHGIELAKEIPPGPNNPFGKYAMRIGTSEYLIHGSNQRMGIGLRASSGCIRMYDQDIKWLFDNVKQGTKIKIIDHPIKMSYEHDGKWLEAHQPLSDAAPDMSIAKALKAFLPSAKKEREQAKQILKQREGIAQKLLVD